MRNSVQVITKKAMVALKEDLQRQDNNWVVEIDGRDIKTDKDYLDTINRLWNFPIPARGFDGYLDWMRDLSWIRANSYALIISDFGEFMKDNIVLKNDIIDDFLQIILPWWEAEVEQCVVEGKAKPFNVYLVV